MFLLNYYNYSLTFPFKNSKFSMEFHNITKINYHQKLCLKLYSHQRVLDYACVKIPTLVPLFLQLATLEISVVDIFKSMPDQ